jgi:RHS repeat-associated protein
MPATVTAPIAPGIGAGSTETRVKALDVLAWPRVGVRSPESPDRRWENRPRYDGKAVGTVLARYYDPATAQFLTVDPRVATTLSPYGYLAGNPLNGTDPSGDCGGPLGFVCTAWDATAGQAVHAVQNSGLCLRNPFGAGWNSNSNGGCQTVLSGSQGAKLAAATVVIAAATVFTDGLADSYIGAYLSAGEEGTALGTLDQIGLLLHAWPVFALPATIYGIGGYLIWSAFTNPPTSTSGSSGCP